MLRGFICIMAAKAMYDSAYLNNNLPVIVDETKPFLVTFLGNLLHNQRVLEQNLCFALFLQHHQKQN